MRFTVLLHSSDSNRKCLHLLDETIILILRYYWCYWWILNLWQWCIGRLSVVGLLALEHCDLFDAPLRILMAASGELSPLEIRSQNRSRSFLYCQVLLSISPLEVGHRDGYCPGENHHWSFARTPAKKFSPGTFFDEDPSTLKLEDRE